MGNTIRVDAVELRNIIDTLEAALDNYNRKFQELDEGITTLTSRGFTGNAAEALMGKYNTQTKSELEEVKRSTTGVINYMKEQQAKFNTLSQTLNDIANAGAAGRR